MRENSQGAHLHGDALLLESQVNRLVGGQFATAEDGQRRQVLVVLPGQLETALDQQLPSVRADDGPIPAAQEDVVGGVAVDVPAGTSPRFVEGAQEIGLQAHGVAGRFR